MGITDFSTADILLQTQSKKSASSHFSDTLVSFNKNYVDWFPCLANAVRIFEGNWSSAVPGFPTGQVSLFDDNRIYWFEEKLGGFAGCNVLELGPLEGGHSTMLTQRGAKVLAIEANIQAYLRCLIIKDLLGLTNVQFLLGDFLKYLEQDLPRFDFVLASGVLYHMQDPVDLLSKIAAAANTIGLWTHYYDQEIIQSKDFLREKFSVTPHIVKMGKKNIVMYEQYYLKSLEWNGFCGGMQPTSMWMTKESILGLLEELGFTYEIGEDDKDHPNGPAFCVIAKRR
jgi:hypothetical protein